MRVAFLGSGSAGNATAVSDGSTTILFDCGFSARETSRRLQSCGMDPSSVAAVFVSHEHVDHVRGLPVFLRRHARDAAVLGAPRTLTGLRWLRESGAETQALAAGARVLVGGLEVGAFASPHDAAEPLGFRVTCRDGHCAALVTDLGHAPEAMLEHLTGVDLLGIEANHDVGMLESGPYPWFLKRRILSREGHLSNGAAADVLSRVATERLRQVVGLHLSRTNNAPTLARDALAVRSSELGLGARVDVAAQDAPLVVEM